MSSTPTRSNPFASIDTLDDFQPKSTLADAPAALDTPNRPSRAEQKAIVSQLAQESGFKINNFEETPLPAKRKTPEPKTFLKTLRIQVADWNKFQLWCNDHDYSHKKGFQLLVESLPRRQS